MNFVLDASAALSWVFEDEHPMDRRSSALLERVMSGEPFAVAPNWTQEFMSALLSGIRRRRTTLENAVAWLHSFDGAGVNVVPIGPMASSLAWHFARTEGVSPYDSAALAIAVSQAIPLATVDTDLQEAARRLKVPLLLE